MIRRALPVLLALALGCAGQISDPGAGGDSDGADGADGSDEGDSGDDSGDGPGGADAAPQPSACEQAGLGEGERRCDAAGVLTCAGGNVTTQSCDDGACYVVAGAAQCVSPTVCAGVGPAGRCTGETLFRCDGGSLAITDCAGGDVCAWGGDTVGYACVAGAGAGARRLAGTVRYEKRPSSTGGLGAPVAVPVKGATIAVVDDASKATLASCSSADDGSYVLRYDAPAGTSVYVVAATTAVTPWRPATVRRSSGNSHGIFSATFTVDGAEAGAPVDLLGTVAGAGEAYNVWNGVMAGFDYTLAMGIPMASLTHLTTNFTKGSGTGSYYDGTLNIQGRSGDSDGYDDSVILHEFGHYFQDAYAVTDNPGGAHDGSPADPRLAWAEGQATYFMTAVLGIPRYIDSSEGGGWGVELEANVHESSMGAGMAQYVSEWMIAELLWDVGDGALDTDADAVNGPTHFQVLRVSTDYMRQNPANRGFSGEDLVDWLDGWFVTHGQETCAVMKQLVHGHYGFPYDFKAPGAACP